MRTARPHREGFGFGFGVAMAGMPASQRCPVMLANSPGTEPVEPAVFADRVEKLVVVFGTAAPGKLGKALLPAGANAYLRSHDALTPTARAPPGLFADEEFHA